MTADDRFNHTYLLDDGRDLGYADFGDPAGFPVLYQHGWPGSRLDIAALDTTAASAGLRIVAIDRSGFGLSSQKPHRTLSGAASDAVELLDSLGVGAFSVLGLSGGGPSALATAHDFADRVRAVAMVSAWGPMGRSELRAGAPLEDRVALGLAARAPWAIRPYTGAMATLITRLSDKRLLKLVSSSLSDTDNELLDAKPDLGAALIRTGREGMRQGGAGATTDLRVTAQPWSFAPGAVTVPVRFYHGAEDPAVPINISEVLSSEIPGASLERYAAQGHLAIYPNAKEILADLKPS